MTVRNKTHTNTHTDRDKLQALMWVAKKQEQLNVTIQRNKMWFVTYLGPSAINKSNKLLFPRPLLAHGVLSYM